MILLDIAHNATLFTAFVLIVIIANTQFALAESVESPRKQWARGILAQDIVCKSGLEVILKVSDKSPICVKPSTAAKLLLRGWGKIISIEKVPSTPPVTNQTKPPVTNQTQTKPNPITPSSTKFSLAFLASKNPTNVQLFESNLQSGDYLIVSTPLGDDSMVSSVLQQASDIKSKVKPGVNVITLVWYSSINDIESKVSNLPKGIDYVAYDYEPWSKTPEYTTDQNQAIALLDRALKVTHNNGFKLMFTPTHGTINGGQIVAKDWDWSNVSQHTDSLVIQFQGYFKLSNGVTEGNNMKNIIKEISAKSPNTLTFVQLALTPVGGTPDENINAINELHSGNINKFLMFYGGPTATDDLNGLLTKIER